MSDVIEHILVPTDFSAPADHALLYAASLGERFGATIHLVHVVTASDVHADGSTDDFPDLEAFLEKADLAARAKLDAGVDHRGMAEATVERVVQRSVNPHEGIVRYAEEHPIDLLVIALHGNSPLSQAVTGSVAEKVIRYAPCPVLVVERGDRDFVDPDTGAVQLDRVVVADDLGDSAAGALAFAVARFAPYAPEVHLVNTVQMKAPRATAESGGISYAYEVNPRQKDKLKGELVSRAEGVVPADWSLVTEVIQGNPIKAIAAYAADVQADLLIIGRETNRTFKEKLVGGTSELFVRHAPCPTLIA